MKKVFCLLFAVTVLVFAFSACGGSGDGNTELTELDSAALAQELVDGDGIFIDLLSPVDTSVALGLYQLDEADVADCLVYCSTGATAEEIAIFQATSEEAVTRIQDAIQNRIDMQITSFESYVPTEVPKLENAIVQTSGMFIVYVTAEDAAAAQTIVDSYFSGNGVQINLDSLAE